MPFVTFTVRRGLSAADKSRLSEAMLEAQVAAGYHRADRFHRFLEVDQDDLLVDPCFPDYATDRTDRFMVVEVVISRGGGRQDPPPPLRTKRSDCSASACTSRLRTSCSSSTRWNRISRAFLLRRSGHAAECAADVDADLLNDAPSNFQPLPKDIATPEFPITPSRVELGRNSLRPVHPT